MVNKTEEIKYITKIEERKDFKEERKEISQTGARRPISTTPSTWWEERKRIEQPRPEDQEKRYREEQEKYGQERQRAEYFRSIQETARPGQEYKERFESEKQTRVEGEEKTDLSQIMSETYKEFYGEWLKTYQESNKELYNLWEKMYGKALDNFFKNTPTFSPFKEIMEPVKNAAKLYSDMFTSMSNIWVKSYNTSKEAV